MSFAKKIEKAREQGQVEGLQFGINWAFDMMEKVLQDTPGIGEKKRAAVMQTMREKAANMREGRE
jgi:hypothetical protein